MTSQSQSLHQLDNLLIRFNQDRLSVIFRNFAHHENYIWID